MSNNAISGIGSLVGFVLLAIISIVVICSLLFAFWIWMIIDCAKRNFKKDIDKVVWLLVIVFLSLLGASIYYFAVKVNDKKKRKKR